MGGIVLAGGAEDEFKVHPSRKPAAKKAAEEQYRVRVFRGYEKHPAGQWQTIYIDQVVPLGTPFDVRNKNDTAAAKGVLQRTGSDRLHFKGSIRIDYNVGAIDAPVELRKPIKAKGGLAGVNLGEDVGIRKYAIFVRFERPKPERPGNVKVIKRASDIHEKVGGGRVFSKGDEVLVVPGPRPQKQLPSQWFQTRLKADNVLRGDKETWILFRSQQTITMYDRMSIERIEQQGNTFIVTMNYTPYLGPVWRNAPYHEVHGINLGKLPAGDYTVKCIIRLSTLDGLTKELKRGFTVRAAP